MILRRIFTTAYATNGIHTSNVSAWNINVTVPNLVRQTRVSVFNFLNIAKTQKAERKMVVDGSAANEQHSPNPILLTHSESTEAVLLLLLHCCFTSTVNI